MGQILGETIAQIQTQTHAWITVHHPAPGDSERVIETSDDVQREPDGRPPQFSPAQDALLLVHHKIVDTSDLDDMRDRNRDRERGDDEDGPSKVTTRMVIPRLHVGCLLGQRGHIIDQMRKETKTHIRILPRDHSTPGCVSMSEEILQVKPMWHGYGHDRTSV
jgi:poly(rC)-binding protein 3/4